MVFQDEFIADEKQIRSVLDYFIEINKLPPSYSYYVALTGKQVNNKLHSCSCLYDTLMANPELKC